MRGNRQRDPGPRGQGSRGPRDRVMVERPGLEDDRGLRRQRDSSRRDVHRARVRNGSRRAEIDAPRWIRGGGERGHARGGAHHRDPDRIRRHAAERMVLAVAKGDRHHAPRRTDRHGGIRGDRRTRRAHGPWDESDIHGPVREAVAQGGRGHLRRPERIPSEQGERDPATRGEDLAAGRGRVGVGVLNRAEGRGDRVFLAVLHLVAVRVSEARGADDQRRQAVRGERVGGGGEGDRPRRRTGKKMNRNRARRAPPLRLSRRRAGAGRGSGPDVAPHGSRGVGQELGARRTRILIGDLREQGAPIEREPLSLRDGVPERITRRAGDENRIGTVGDERVLRSGQHDRCGHVRGGENGRARGPEKRRVAVRVDGAEPPLGRGRLRVAEAKAHRVGARGYRDLEDRGRAGDVLEGARRTIGPEREGLGGRDRRSVAERVRDPHRDRVGHPRRQPERVGTERDSVGPPRGNRDAMPGGDEPGRRVDHGDVERAHLPRRERSRVGAARKRGGGAHEIRIRGRGPHGIGERDVGQRGGRSRAARDRVAVRVPRARRHRERSARRGGTRSGHLEPRIGPVDHRDRPRGIGPHPGAVRDGVACARCVEPERGAGAVGRHRPSDSAAQRPVRADQACPISVRVVPAQEELRRVLVGRADQGAHRRIRPVHDGRRDDPARDHRDPGRGRNGGRRSGQGGIAEDVEIDGVLHRRLRVCRSVPSAGPVQDADGRARRLKWILRGRAEEETNRVPGNGHRAHVVGVGPVDVARRGRIRGLRRGPPWGNDDVDRAAGAGEILGRGVLNRPDAAVRHRHGARAEDDRGPRAGTRERGRRQSGSEQGHREDRVARRAHARASARRDRAGLAGLGCFRHGPRVDERSRRCALPLNRRDLAPAWTARAMPRRNSAPAADRPVNSASRTLLQPRRWPRLAAPARGAGMPCGLQCGIEFAWREWPDSSRPVETQPGRATLALGSRRRLWRGASPERGASRRRGTPLQPRAPDSGSRAR